MALFRWLTAATPGRGCSWRAGWWRGPRLVILLGYTKTHPFPRLRQPPGGGYDHKEDCQHMTREYEAVYIFDSALEDAAISEKLGRHHGLLSLTEEAKLDIWGRRQLAYKIGRHENGYYVVARFAADTTTLPEFERSLKLDDGVIRYLISLYEHELGIPADRVEANAARARALAEEDDDEDED
ncbi:MAG: 30S ribosomal protein S6 [Gemmatimonadales bacterium]